MQLLVNCNEYIVWVSQWVCEWVSVCARVLQGWVAFEFKKLAFHPKDRLFYNAKSYVSRPALQSFQILNNTKRSHFSHNQLQIYNAL